MLVNQVLQCKMQMNTYKYIHCRNIKTLQIKTICYYNHFLFRTGKSCVIINIPTYLNTYIHTHIHTYIHTYLHIHTYINTYTQPYIHTTIHTSIHMYVYIHTHTYIHIYINTYTQSHNQHTYHHTYKLYDNPSTLYNLCLRCMHVLYTSCVYNVCLIVVIIYCTINTASLKLIILQCSICEKNRLDFTELFSKCIKILINK